MNSNKFKTKILDFIKAREHENGYEFFYTDTIKTPVLYNTLFAVMIWHMLDVLKDIPEDRLDRITEYIKSFQCEDGLFKDLRLADSPDVLGEGWGWGHLTQHAVMALYALEEKADRSFSILDDFYDLNFTKGWLEMYAEMRMWYLGNAAMYRLNMLQTEKEWFENQRAQKVIDFMLDYFDKIQDPQTGMLLEKDYPYSPLMMTRAVQVCYHIWEPVFYEKRKLNYPERIIDGLLWTQNSLGGYSINANPSGCEDIDSIAPLVRLYHETDYRKTAIKDSLYRGYDWVMSNQNPDGGFVNMRDKAYIYGHILMKNEINQSDIFSTWWRLLSIKYLNKVVHNDVLDGINWQFINCPGYDFWFKD